MIKEFFVGIASYNKAFSFLFRPALLRNVLYTGAISLALAFLMFVGIAILGVKAVSEITHIPKNAPESKSILAAFMALLPFIFSILLVFTLYKNVVLIFCSPFLSIISAKTEILLTGNENVNESSWKELMYEIWRGIRMALWASFQELKITLPLMLLNFIPVVGNIAAFASIFLVQSYFSGANNLDFTLERRKHNMEESVKIIHENRALVTGSGFIFMVLMYIPFIGFLIAPALAVISATILYVEDIQKT